MGLRFMLLGKFLVLKTLLWTSSREIFGKIGRISSKRFGHVMVGCMAPFDPGISSHLMDAIFVQRFLVKKVG